MAKKQVTGFRKFIRYTLRVILILFGSSLLYVIICRFVEPPVTITQLGGLTGGYGLKRDYVSWDEISRNVKLAAIASEDQLFPEHNGFDWKAMDKSLNRPHKKKRIAGGGASTISQQTAKNVFLWQGSGIGRYIRKAPEFYFTALIELAWGKRRIMEVYLNTIEMGPGIFGIEAASQQYFHKHAKNLSRAEAAMIIACLPNPKKFSVTPISHRVAWRYPQIMEQMDNLEGDEDVEAVIKTP
ncbi:MAG: monofunctional biosynthetic peptidoglycan transglycosylase [Flavipsychrobacter sp.]|nr:monofunctional biosynthetic peptidoglycan transglycosylase [Flavipsychrobacter sp.]